MFVTTTVSFFGFIRHMLAHIPVTVLFLELLFRGTGSRLSCDSQGQVMLCDSHLSHHWGLRVTHHTRKGGKYWINGNYSVGRWIKSELGCYKGTKAQTFQNHSAAMIVMTQSTHMVVVFLLCHVGYGGLPT